MPSEKSLAERIAEIREPWDETRCRICGCSVRPLPGRRADSPRELDAIRAMELLREMPSPELSGSNQSGWMCSCGSGWEYEMAATPEEAIALAWLAWKERK